MAIATWILLRGLTRGRHHWAGFDRALEAAMPASRVLALDLPGNGELFEMQSPTCVADMVLNVRNQLQQCGAVGPVGVLAVSMGGMVATQWAQTWPKELALLVLVNTSMRPYSNPLQRLLAKNYLHLLSLPFASEKPVDQERTILKMTSNHAQLDVLDHWAQMRKSQPVSSMNALRQLWASARFRAHSSAPQMPTLILGSHGDSLVSPLCSMQLAKAWGVELRMHPSAGHDLTLDAGDWVLAEVQRACGALSQVQGSVR
jgi:pimeloyl-ACP methyl ester carboxylesterase